MVSRASSRRETHAQQDAGLSSGLFKGNPAALSAAFGIVQFIGDLYQRCMLPASFVQRALKTLVGAGGSGPMVAIEQLRALRLLLSYVRDSRLRRVDPDGMVQIMAAFSVSWARVNTSWMGEPFERNELKMHFQVNIFMRALQRDPLIRVIVRQQYGYVLEHASKPATGDVHSTSPAHPTSHSAAGVLAYIRPLCGLSLHSFEHVELGSDCRTSGSATHARLRHVFVALYWTPHL